MTDTAALVKRLEEATVGGRGLDGLIAFTLGWRFNGCREYQHIESWEKIAGHWYSPEQLRLSLVERLKLAQDVENFRSPPFYTTLLDAALMLVGEERRWVLERCRVGLWPSRDYVFHCCVYTELDEAVGPSGVSRAPTASLAVCIAALRARAMTQAQEQE
jgi:hypothetical protein